MKYEVILEIEDKEELENILEYIGFDIETITKVFYKKILNERGVSFLFNNANPNIIKNFDSKPVSSEIIKNDEIIRVNKMTKTIAISLLEKHGVVFNRHNNLSFSSKNKSTYVYWSNPPFEFLQDDWKLILNDYINRKLHYFVIPKNSINGRSLTARNDQLDKIDLQINYSDHTFTDSRSGYSFAPFLKKTIDY